MKHLLVIFSIFFSLCAANAVECGGSSSNFAYKLTIEPTGYNNDHHFILSLQPIRGGGSEILVSFFNELKRSENGYILDQRISQMGVPPLETISLDFDEDMMTYASIDFMNQSSRPHEGALLDCTL